MVEIIRLHGDPHIETQRLLPWYVNGTLEGEELAAVDAHLAECSQCRESVSVEEALARQIKSLPNDVDRGWAALRARVEGPDPGKAKAAERTIFRRRVPVGWALAASLVLVIPAMVIGLSRQPALYRTLSSAPAAESGNIVVIFRPDASEQTLRTILVQNGARIVDGPTSTDAYVLHVPGDQRPAALARLRGNSNISLAAPIDGDARP